MSFTLGTTYYENPEHLKEFVSKHLPYVDELIVVDDGSQVVRAAEVITPRPRLKLYRVTKDYGFNSHGCRNLIMNEASNDWVALVDVDRVFLDGGKELLKIDTSVLDINIKYKFIVHVLKEGHKVHQGVNDYIINKQLFFKAGGYDEELIGIRNGDRDFFYQLCHFGKIQTIDVNLMHTRIASAYISQEQDKAALNNVPFNKSYTQELHDLVESRKIKPDPNKPILTFDWERVF